MTTTTHHIEVGEGAYVNLSNGNLNCTIVVKYPQEVRLHFGGEEPLADTPDYIPIKNLREGDPRIVSVSDLGAESDVWARAEYGGDVVTVVRGEAIIIVT